MMNLNSENLIEEEESGDSESLDSDDEIQNLNDSNIDNIKQKITDMVKIYYKKNKTNNIFDDCNGEKICKKEKMKIIQTISLK